MAAVCAAQSPYPEILTQILQCPPLPDSLAIQRPVQLGCFCQSGGRLSSTPSCFQKTLILVNFHDFLVLGFLIL